MDFLPSAHTAAVMIIVALSIAGYLLTFAPVVPGTLMVPLGAVAYGLIEGFHPFAWYFWVGQAVLVAVYLIVDNVAQHYGVKRIGGSKEAMWGGVLGVVLGPFLVAPFLGPFALFVGPPLGAVAGALLGQAYSRRQDNRRGEEASADGTVRPVYTADQQRDNFFKNQRKALKAGYRVDPGDPRSDAAQVLPVGSVLQGGIVSKDGEDLAPSSFAAPAEHPSNLKLAVGALAAYMLGTAAKMVVLTIQVVWIALAL